LIVALNRAGERIEMRRQLRAYTENLEHLVEEKSRQLIEAERLAAVGETVAGLSHTIKNIAGGTGWGDLRSGKRHRTGGRRLSQAGMGTGAVDNVDRIKHVSLDLLNFAKTDRLTYRRVNPEQPARDVFELMQSRAREHGMDLMLEVAAGLVPTQMDPAGIHQCLMNLVTNAIDACMDTEPADGVQRITLIVRPTANGGVCYQVADTCCGMDERTKNRLFQRFFTTKGDRGTGIGLMLTRTIVQRHNGTIDVSSQPGKGSVFTIKLTGKPPE
jgi:signal transduction histidine kinase